MIFKVFRRFLGDPSSNPLSIQINMVHTPKLLIFSLWEKVHSFFLMIFKRVFDFPGVMTDEETATH